MYDYDDYGSYNGDPDHDMWVDHTYNQYTNSAEELYEDYDDEYLEDFYEEDLEDELDIDLDDEELDDEDLDLDDIDDEDLDDEYLDDEDLDDEELDDEELDEFLDEEFAEYLEEKGLVDEFDNSIKNTNNLSRDTGLDKINNTPIPTFPETHRPIKPSFFQRLKKLFRL